MTNNTHTNIIFAYGGLILPESRSKTLGTEVKAAPAILNGYERFWGFRVPDYHLTTVSLRPNENATCAGVLFPVTVEQLKRLDLREEGYLRVKLSKERILLLSATEVISSEEMTVYTYMSEVYSVPDLENPIAQSDIDAILIGSLKLYGEEFTREIIKTTVGWSNHWVNDRKKPRYPWSVREVQLANTIDKILRDLVPIAFNKRRRETTH